MISKDTVVVYDLDSTVADTRHRWGLTPRNDPASDWEKYSLACSGDTALPGTVRRMELDWPYHQVHICTGRSRVALERTEQWLLKHVGPFWDHLEMRPARDRTPNGEFKIRYVRKLQAAGLDVVLFYEDWEKSANEIYDETKVPVLGINPFYPETQQGGI
jgi:hypothetical protein